MAIAEDSFTYPIFSGNHIDPSYLSNVADTLLLEGANTVQVNPFLTQATSTSSSIITSSDLNNTNTQFLNPPTDAELEQIIGAFQAKGLNIELKVSLQPQDNTWSGAIAPSDVDVWFANYTAALVDYAKVAQAEGITKLIITNELQSVTTNPAYLSKWTDLIAQVRAVYSGQIGVNATVPFEAQNLTFGSQLDFIGVSLYPTLTTNTNPTLPELIGDWTHDANGNNWVSILTNLHSEYNKPIEISEIAFESRQGAASQANTTSLSGPVDQAAQLNEYQSFFDVFSSLPGSWFQGVSFWQALESSPDSWAVASDQNDYGPYGPTVVGKPAESVVAAWFGGKDVVPWSGRSFTGSGNNDQIYLYDPQGATEIMRSATYSATISFTLDGTIIGNQVPTVHVYLDGVDYGQYTLTIVPGTYVDTSGINWTQLQTFEITIPSLASISELKVNFDSPVNLSGPENSQVYFRSVAINGVSLTSAAYHPLSGSVQSQNVQPNGNASEWDGGYTIFDTTPWNTQLTGAETLGSVGSPISIDGGGGLDAVHVLGPQSAYTVAQNLNGSWSLSENSGLDQNAILTNVSVVDFADSTQIQLGGSPAPCFVSGTLIKTTRGDVAVDLLVPTDQVITPDGRPAEIKWIGRRSVDFTALSDPNPEWPVRISMGAFAANIPQRDLCLSPDHAVFVDGVLIPIKHLINETTVRRMPKDEVTYYHVELEEHGLILAEAMPCESYLDNGDRWKFAGGSESSQLLGGPSIFAWEANGCAALVVTGSALSAVRNALSQRAAARPD